MAFLPAASGVVDDDESEVEKPQKREFACNFA